MLKTKNIITDIKDVPTEWVFEHYLKLTEKLTGQRLLVLSPFNINDKRPSLSLFTGGPTGRQYMYKDFSTQNSGDNINFVMKLFNFTTRGETAHKIIDDYNTWLNKNNEDYSQREFVYQTRYKVIESHKRGWTKDDERFWTQFYIDSKTLELYKVVPLESYVMQRQVGDATEEIKVEKRTRMYGYYRADDTLYKIYQPMLRDYKFLKIRDYIQGTDQLTYQKKYLVICSSLKDIMAFNKLGYNNIECVAPDSENTLIQEHVINAYKIKYTNVCTLFDMDRAGLEAMHVYEDRYGIKGTRLILSKDLSDSIRDHGIQRVLKELTPNLRLALKKNE